MEELRDKLQKRINEHEGKKNAVDAERDGLKVQVGEREGDIGAERRARENERKTLDDLVRERDILNKNLGAWSEASRRPQRHLEGHSALAATLLLTSRVTARPSPDSAHIRCDSLPRCC